MQKRFKPSITLATLLLLGVQNSCTNEDGVYPNLSALTKELSKEGFQFLGQIGNEWPATLVDFKEGKEKIDFAVPGKAPQSYSGFKGYLLRAYLMQNKDSGKEFVVVFKRKLQG